MEEISLQKLFFIIKKRLRMIILFFIISVVIAGIVTFFIVEPEYETFTTLMVGNPQDYKIDSNIEYVEFNELLLNQKKVINTYVVLMNSRDVADKIIQKFELDMSYKYYNKKVSIGLIENTDIIKITVTDKDPKRLADMANEIVSVSIDSVEKLMKVENVRVIDKARVPITPIKSNKLSNLVIAGFLGAMAGVILAFFLEFFDTTIKTPEDVKNHLNLSTIGVIPKGDSNQNTTLALTNQKLATIEAFRTLRTNLKFSDIEKKLKTIVVASSSLDEGASIVSVNLAGVIAQGEERVLLIDCDLRKPKIHEILELNNLEGLTDILTGDKLLEEVSCKYKGFKNFEIITSGPILSNSVELLGSKRMSVFMEIVKEEYDMVILNTPPVGLVTDSAVLSTMADGIILVAAVSETDIENVVRSKDILDKVGANIIGIVLNKVPIKEKSYYEYRYYNGFDYYGEDDDKRSKMRKY